MSDAENIINQAKSEQRTMFVFSFLVAIVPVIVQLIVLSVVSEHKSDFIHYEGEMFSGKFWCIQFLLVCLSVVGASFFDYMKATTKKPPKKAMISLQAGALMLIFIYVCILFSLTLLDTEGDFVVAVEMGILDVVGIVLSYRVEMDIALLEYDMLDCK